MRTISRCLAVAAASVLVAPTVLLTNGAGATAVVATAPTFVVTSTADLPDATADGICRATNDACTLRAAIGEANRATGVTTIAVSPGRYTLRAGPGDGAGDLDLAKPMHVVGAAEPPGPAATTIDAAGVDRVVEVASTGTTIEGVVLTGGAARAGAGILVQAGAGLDLVDSTVAANTAADQGGGVDNAGTLRVIRSTIASNVAVKKGGGFHNAGQASLVNSTVHGNRSSAGGGLLSTGTADLDHVTVTANESTNKLGGGVQRAGGVTNLTATIVAANLSNSSDAKDCSGSPNLDGPNLIGNVQGCNPTGTPPLVGDAGLGPLDDHGGPTETQRLLPASRAIDAAGTAGAAGSPGAPCAVAVDTDQRGIARPQGPACDLGSYEVDPLGLTVDLTTDTPTIGAGAAIVRNADLLDMVSTSGGPTASPLRSIPLRSILVDSIDFESVPLRSIDVVDAPLRSIPLRSIPLRSIFTAFAPLRSIPLRSISLDAILLSEVELDVEGGWAAVLAGTPLQDVPLQSLTLSDVAGLTGYPGVEALTLEQVDLSSTRIGALSLVSILLGATPLRSIELADGGLLCDLLGDVCDAAWFSDDTSLLSAELAGAPLRSIPLRSIPLAELDLASSPLRSIPLRSIRLADLATGSVATVVNCERFACDDPDATIGDAFDAGALHGTMADLILAVVGDENLAWEDVDLKNGGLGAVADPPEPGVTYRAELELRGGLVADIQAAITLPDGFVAVPGSVRLDGNALPDPAFADQTLSMTFDDVGPGSHTLTFSAKAGVVLGEHLATITATATAVGLPPVSATDDVATIVVDEAFEAPTPAEDHRPLVANALHIAHISEPGDIDLYGFDVSTEQAANGATISIRLSNLAADFDLALYGPPASSLRGPPTEHRDLLPDHLVDLLPGDDRLTSEPTADVPRNLPFESDAVIHRIGGRRDNSTETLEAVGLRAGTYWIQVSGANGATSEEPYVLRTRRAQGSDRGPCAAPPLTGTSTSRASSLPNGLDTLFIVNSRRFLAAHPGAGPSTLDAVESFASSDDLGFTGGVLYVDKIAAVQQAYGAWDANRCSPDAANAVVRAIGVAVDGVARDHPGLTNLVIVGNDAQVPMARVADNTVIANERTFADELSTHDELVAALGAGTVLTDDALATETPIGVNDHEVFVPERAVGRLVETPQEILAVLNSYTAAGGRLDPSTALVTGYDFLSDGADAVADELEGQGDGVDRLIDETWDRDALSNALGAERRGVASINAHFDHHRLLPALGNSTGDESDLFTTDDVAPVADGLLGSLLFSMGCHSGLSVSDVTIGGARDWAQTYAGAGAHWVGNTGYGYGDTATVALSEQLMAAFARRLIEGASVGEALAGAKRQYMSVRPLVSAYDEKVVQEAVLYGLPMLRIGDTATSAPAPGLAALASAAPSAASSLAPTVIDPITGLDSAPASFELSVTNDPTDAGPATLTPRHTPGGSYYHVDGQTLTQSRRPIEPLTSADVTRPDARARGFLITELESRDLTDFEPLFFSPTVDLAAHEPRAVAADATFPSTIAAITSTNAPGGREDRVVVAPGQYRRSEQAGLGTQRLFTDIGGVVYYGDDAPPGPAIGVRQTTAEFRSGRVRFNVELDQPATRVYVLYKLLETNASARWQGIDLVKGPGGTAWIGHGSAAGQVEYIVQAVGADGRVHTAARKGDNFGSVDGTVGELAIATDPVANAAGWNAGDVTIAISGPDGADVGTILYSLDGAAYATYSSPFVVRGSGPHSIAAVSTEGYSGQRIVLIDALRPVVTATVRSPGAADPAWNAEEVTIDAAATDAGGSGIVAFTASVDDGPAAPVDGPIVISTGGRHTVRFSALDRAGNQSLAVTVVVNVDGTAPTVTCGAADGQWHADNVTVSCTAADATPGSGLVGPSTLSASTAVAAGSADATAATNEVTVCDVAGNCSSTRSLGHKIDRADPVASVTSPSQGATIDAGTTFVPAFGCTDVGSSIATCVATVDGVALAAGAPLPTTVLGLHTLTVTATDLVGRTHTRSVTFTVFGYRICPQYDQDQPNIIGSTIPIKLQLCDANGRNVSSSSLVVRAVTIDGTTLPPPNFVGNTNFGNVFRFGQKSYIYNLDTSQLATLSAGAHTMELSVNGARIPTYQVRFTLR